MWGWRIRGAFVVVVSAVLASCGPGQTTQEQEDEQIHEHVEKERAIYEPLGGTYRGKLSRSDRNSSFTIDLILEPFSIYQPDPGRGKRREVPSIRGSIIVYENGSNIFAFQYSQGLYDPETKKLHLDGRGIGNENDAAKYASLDAIVDGDHIVGYSRSSVDSSANKIDVKRLRGKR